MKGFKLGGRVIEPTHHSIRAGSKVTRLRPVCWDVLMCLVDHHGEIVSIDALMETVWPGQTADPVYVRKAIHEIRAALEDRERQVVKTLPRVGYIIETSALEDVDSGEETEEGEASSLRTPSHSRALVYGRLSSGDYKGISRRLRKKAKGTPP